MPGAGLSLTLEGLVDVERRLARLADQLGDLTPLMDILGMEIEVDIGAISAPPCCMNESSTRMSRMPRQSEMSAVNCSGSSSAATARSFRMPSER